MRNKWNKETDGEPKQNKNQNKKYFDIRKKINIQLKHERG